MIKFFIPHKQEGEKIILLIRRHWFIIFKRLFFWTIIGALPLGAFLSFRELTDFFTASDLLGPVSILFLSIYYLYVLLFLINSFVDYYLDVWIVTNERIINIEQRQLFSRISAEQKLFRIQDVTSEVNGIFATFLNYGTVYIQSAAETQRFTFKQIPHPEEVAQKINALAEYKRRYQKVKEMLDKDI